MRYAWISETARGEQSRSNNGNQVGRGEPHEIQYQKGKRIDGAVWRANVEGALLATPYNTEERNFRAYVVRYERITRTGGSEVRDIFGKRK